MPRVAEIIAKLEDDYSVIVCRNGCDYSYVIPNQDILKKKHRERYQHILELLRELHDIAKQQKQVAIRREVEENKQQACYLLPDRRELYVGERARKFVVLVVDKIKNKEVIFKHPALKACKTLADAQHSLDELAKINNLLLTER